VSRKYLIETYGCQMNYHDSEQMAGLLEAAGYDRTDDDQRRRRRRHQHVQRARAREEKLYTRLGELRVLGEETGRDPLVAVAGCVAQQEGATLLKRSSQVDVVVGTRRTRMLPMLVAQAETERRPQVDLGAHDNVAVSVRPHTTRRCGSRVGDDHRGLQRVLQLSAWSRTRGATSGCGRRRRSWRRSSAAAGQGLKEVQLLGQIVNHYQAPDEARLRLRGMLEAVHEVPGIERIRFAEPASAARDRPAGWRRSRPPEGLQAPAPASAVRVHAVS
jgi:tRNA-2-methylthio-N6-dimethylallyladenosine synthase